MRYALKEEEKLNIRHNWLYSVVPIVSKDRPNGIYLVGYCKLDNKYFTVKLNTLSTENMVFLDDLNIPKDGCNPPEM